MNHETPTGNASFTEADLDTKVVVPFLASIGIGPNQIRAQRTFSLRLGRNMVHQVGGSAKTTAGGRLDYVIVGVDGRPLFVVELKAPTESLTDDDRDQGISYARLLDSIAPFVLVSNGKESQLYDTITRRLIDSAADSSFFRDGQRLSADADLRIRYEALQHFVGYSVENVRAFSAAQIACGLAALRGGATDLTKKYIPEVHVTRSVVGSAIARFLASNKVLFCLGGNSGTGKTNEMCALAEQLAADHLVLFFNGTVLYHSLERALADEFNWNFSDNLELPQICQRLNILAAAAKQPLVLLIDAVDETDIDHVEREFSTLISRFATLNGALRVVVSAKPEEWSGFLKFRGVGTSALDTIYCESPHEPSNAGTSPARMSIILERFTLEEVPAVVRRYAQVFGISAEWPTELIGAATDPFMLRVIADVAREHGSLPAVADEPELLRRYVQGKVERTPDPAAARRDLVAVATALSQGSSDSDLDVASSWSGHAGAQHSRRTNVLAPVSEGKVRETAGLSMTAPIGDALVSVGLLIRQRDLEDRLQFAFSYDRVRDYVIATQVFEFDRLVDRDGFRDAARRAIGAPAGAPALLWYLPRVNQDQWAGFVDIAHAQVGRMLDAYEAIRACLAPTVRACMDPNCEGPIGAVFAVDPSRRWFSLALFQRDAIGARVRLDVGVFHWLFNPTGSKPKFGVSRGRSSTGFWYLYRPERCGARLAVEELRRLAKGGLLDAEGDPYLDQEAVVAILRAHHGRLRFASQSSSATPPLTDAQLGADHYPLDLRALRVHVQAQLGFAQYEREWVDQRLKEVVKAKEARGQRGGIVSVAHSADDTRPLRQRAEREALAGATFLAGSARPDIRALSRALDRLLQHGVQSIGPLLPAPDLAGARLVHTFEDGYSDSQLVRFLETFFQRSLNSYAAILSSSFSSPLRDFVDSRPFNTAIVYCHRPTSIPKLQPAAQATVAFILSTRPSPSVEVHLGPPPQSFFQGGRGNFADAGGAAIMALMMPLNALLGGLDAKPLVPGGDVSAGRSAPVRAFAYYLVRTAVDRLTVESLSGGS